MVDSTAPGGSQELDRAGRRDDRGSGRCGWPRCVPGVSWRPWQAVAATRRPGR